MEPFAYGKLTVFAIIMGMRAGVPAQMSKAVATFWGTRDECITKMREHNALVNNCGNKADYHYAYTPQAEHFGALTIPSDL